MVTIPLFLCAAMQSTWFVDSSQPGPDAGTSTQSALDSRAQFGVAQVPSRVTSQATSPAQPPSGPELFAAPGVDGRPAVAYFGEPAKDGRIALNAWNGFFDSGAFVAKGASPAPEAEAPFIGKHFEYLQVGGQAGSARWHLWTEAAGELEVTAYLTVPEAEAGTAWTLSCDGYQYPVKSRASAGEATEGWKLRLPVGAGKHRIVLTPKDPEAVRNTRIHRIELGGEVAESAKLLRARWRPAAVHTAYASSTLESSSLWVFESKSLNGASSYSPINTPFGYFGTTFDSSRSTPRGFNFSMWATGKGKKAPPLASMPHLLATGNPEAEFSGFGHEGSGVKLRGWDCLDWDPASVVQALRMERRGERDLYYGYFYHQPKQRWILYAVGARPSKGRNAASASFSKVTAFCEIPGPPQRQRSGDVERRMARRGWFLESLGSSSRDGARGAWHPADVHSGKDKQSTSARRIAASEDDWHVSLAGGMEIIDAPASLKLPPTKPGPLPEFLQPEKVEQLFQLPVRFKEHGVEDLKRTTARVRYALRDMGPDVNAEATLYYGPIDCLTFVSRELHGTERKGASADFYTSDRTWAHQTRPKPAQDGVHRFQLRELTPNTQYFYRALVTTDKGKSWAFDTGTFTTRK